MSTLSDVAREAKVSTITVSRVINTPDKVKPMTRDRVLRAMEKVQYVQNPVAKALVSKRVGIIDVYIPDSIDLSNPFVMHLIAGISESLSKNMYSFLIMRDRKREHRCDGYIVTGLLTDEIRQMHQYALERKRPMALFGHCDDPDIDCIDVDNIEGVRQITEYVLQRGHQNLIMVNVDEDKDYTRDRHTGFRRALEEAGHTKEAPSVYAENSVQGGYDAAVGILERADRPDAVICATDDIAIGVVRAVVDAGLRVPEDIAVTGYDGLGHHLMSNPAITTVQQPVYEIGRLLADTLLKRIQGEAGRKKQSIRPALLEGRSVSSTGEQTFFSV